MRRQLDYVCLQPTREGQASHAHVNEIVAGLRRRGWEVQLIEPPHPRPGRLDGIRRAFAAAATQLRYSIRCRLQPAPFVYIRTHFLSLPTAVLATAAGATVVQEVNGSSGDTYAAWPLLRPLHSLLSFAVNSQLRLADAVIAVTPGLRERVVRVTGRPGRCHVVGNGADVERFRPMGGASITAPPYVVFVGALASWQGIDIALSATKRPAWPADVVLVIAGDGKERDRVRAAASGNPRIRWLGTVPYPEIPPLMSEALGALVPKNDVPSTQFGLSPLKLFEAMASGVPVIASDLPGLSDVVRRHDCGILFPAGDADALARAVSELAEDRGRTRAMGDRGRAAAVAYYSWDARAGETEAVLLRAASKGTRSSRKKGFTTSRH
jgi:glycosyltransferase involved in cell wall biosynthesis